MHRPPGFRSTRAAGQLAALAGAALLAASAWAAGLPEEGYLLDAALWRSEVAQSASGHWPAEGWYRLLPGGRSIDVRPPDPRQPAPEQDEGWYVHVPGVAMKTGARPLYRMTATVAQPTAGREYQLMLGRTPFGFTVQEDQGALAYTLRYGGREFTYRLAAAGTPTRVRAIADLDGDAFPDFVVDAGESTYLLLSRPAQPGTNLPSAELWAGQPGC